MRLDHLLSKEKIIVKFVLSLGWALVSVWLVASFLSLRGAGEVPGGGRFLFAGESKSHTHFVCACGGIDETKAFAVFRPCWLEGLSKVCLCFGFDGLFCCLACCWVSGATQVCCSIDHPFV